MAEKKSYVFEENNVPFQICHATNCLALDNNDLLVTWFAGSREGNNDIAIWISRFSKGKWEKSVVIADDKDEPNWNPVLHQLKGGRLLLFYKVGRDIHSWRTMIQISDDRGETWTEPRELVPGDKGGRGPVRTKVLTLSDQSLLAGSSSEQGVWTTFTDRSIDEGKSWVRSESIALNDISYHGEKTVSHTDIEVSEQSFYGRGIIQPTLWESEDGNAHMLMRSSEGRIYRADSTDFGKTWSPAYATSLPNNNSGIDVVRLSNGSLVLCYNPVAENWGERTPLRLAISKDNGNTWEDIYTLEEGEGEFSYPSITRKDQTIYLSYTWNRKRVAVWRFEEKELEE